MPLYEFPADVRITADAECFLRDLLETLRRLRTPAQATQHAQRWAAMQRQKQAQDERVAARVEADRRAGIPTPLAVSAAVNAVVDEEDLVAWELADSSAVRRTRPGTMFEKGGSSLGWAVAALTGARYADPERPAVCLTGDGSYMFGITQVLLWTQQHLDGPVLTVVFNNRGYRTGTETLVDRYPNGYAASGRDFAGGEFDPPPDFAAEAQAAGAYGAQVLSLAQLDEVLASARKAVEVDRRPAVIDVWLPAHVTGAHPLQETSS